MARGAREKKKNKYEKQKKNKRRNVCLAAAPIAADYIENEFLLVARQGSRIHAHRHRGQ